MSTVPLAQSADKQVLFARLGLNEQIHKLLLVWNRPVASKSLANVGTTHSKRLRTLGTLLVEIRIT